MLSLKYDFWRNDDKLGFILFMYVDLYLDFVLNWLDNVIVKVYPIWHREGSALFSFSQYFDELLTFYPAIVFVQVIDFSSCGKD